MVLNFFLRLSEMQEKIFWKHFWDFNSLHATSLFLHLLKISEKTSFLMFLSDIGRNQWHEINW